MNILNTIILLTCLVVISLGRCEGNVYAIIYATLDGKTGHAGIAVDNYHIISSDDAVGDTVANGTLSYFDLWPSKDDFGLFSYSKDQEAMYYELPNGIWSTPLTLTYLHDFGIPHREHYPPDAILMMRTTPSQDQSLVEYLRRVIAERTTFNPRFYNCTDFVREALAAILGQKVTCREFIPFSFTSTPNKLCRRLMRMADVVVVKAPGHRIKGSFFRERILERGKRRKADNPFLTRT